MHLSPPPFNVGPEKANLEPGNLFDAQHRGEGRGEKLKKREI